MDLYSDKILSDPFIWHILTRNQGFMAHLIYLSISFAKSMMRRRRKRRKRDFREEEEEGLSRGGGRGSYKRRRKREL